MIFWGITAIRLLLFLGTRKQEILKLRWEDIDAQSGTIRLPDSKTGAKTLYLNAPAVEVIRKMAERRHVDSPWVLQGAKPKTNFRGIQGVWGRVLKKAGLEGLRIHDLRYTAASMGAMMGLGLPIIGGLLGHTRAETTQRYAHLVGPEKCKMPNKSGAKRA